MRHQFGIKTISGPLQYHPRRVVHQADALVEKVAALNGTLFDFRDLSGQITSFQDASQTFTASWLNGSNTFDGSLSVNSNTSFEISPVVENIQSFALFVMPFTSWASSSWGYGSPIGKTGPNKNRYDQGGIGLQRWSSSNPVWGYWRSTEGFSAPNDVFMNGVKISNPQGLKDNEKPGLNTAVFNLKNTVSVDRLFSSGLGRSAVLTTYVAIALFTDELTQAQASDLTL